MGHQYARPLARHILAMAGPKTGSVMLDGALPEGRLWKAGPAEIPDASWACFEQCGRFEASKPVGPESGCEGLSNAAVSVFAATQ